MKTLLALAAMILFATEVQAGGKRKAWVFVEPAQSVQVPVFVFPDPPRPTYQVPAVTQPPFVQYSPVYTPGTTVLGVDRLSTGFQGSTVTAPTTMRARLVPQFGATGGGGCANGRCETVNWRR